MKSRSFPAGCFLPMNSLAIHPHGSFKFCMSSYHSGLSDLSSFESERKDIHTQLLDNKWPDSCRSCRRKEEAGAQSRRTRTWERKSSRYGEDSVTTQLNSQQSSQLKHLEITFSNVCNLTCAMCSSEFSSSWVRLDKEAVEQGLEFRNFTAKYQKVSRLDSKVLDLVYAQIHEAELIIVKGGEPTREPLLFDFLKKIKEKNLRKDLRLFIQTNGTRDFDEWKEHLSGFDLEIGFSIDGWGEVNDWIRSTRFEDVIQNLRKVHDSELVKEISIDFTLSSFNCFHLPVFLKKIAELSLELPKIRTCPVFQWVQQYYASPLALSASVRSKIADEIEPILNEYSQLFLNYENLLKILRLPRLKPELIEQAQKWTSFMGRKRGVSLFDLEPRLAAAMAFDQDDEIQK